MATFANPVNMKPGPFYLLQYPAPILVQKDGGPSLSLAGSPGLAVFL